MQGKRWLRDVCRLHFYPPIIYLNAPSKGMDTNAAIERVVALLDFLKAKRGKQKTIVKLKELGLKSQIGKLRK
jgi:hypothetical protein